MPYYSREIIDKIRDIDLLTYLENYEPDELVKLNERIYSTRELWSLTLSRTVCLRINANANVAICVSISFGAI